MLSPGRGIAIQLQDPNIIERTAEKLYTIGKTLELLTNNQYYPQWQSEYERLYEEHKILTMAVYKGPAYGMFAIRNEDVEPRFREFEVRLQRLQDTINRRESLAMGMFGTMMPPSTNTLPVMAKSAPVNDYYYQRALQELTRPDLKYVSLEEMKSIFEYLIANGVTKDQIRGILRTRK